TRGDRSFFFSSRRRHTRFSRDWSSDVCSSDLRCTGTMAARPAGAVPQDRARCLARARDQRRAQPPGAAHDRGGGPAYLAPGAGRSEEHTSELQSRENLVCRLLLEKKKLSDFSI